MADIKRQEIHEILTANMLEFADTGYMTRNALQSFEKPTEFIFFYDTNRVDYIPYVEGKWISPRWNGKKNPNEGFIKVKAAGKLERLIYSKLLNIPYNHLADNQMLLQRNHLTMVELGVMQDV